MTEPTRFTREDELGFYFAIESCLEEDQVWYATVLPLLEGLPENDIDIWQYCVTEMVNNAIDHSLRLHVDGDCTKATFEHPDSGAR